MEAQAVSVNAIGCHRHVAPPTPSRFDMARQPTASNAGPLNGFDSSVSTVLNIGAELHGVENKAA